MNPRALRTVVLVVAVCALIWWAWRSLAPEPAEALPVSKLQSPALSASGVSASPPTPRVTAAESVSKPSRVVAPPPPAVPPGTIFYADRKETTIPVVDLRKDLPFHFAAGPANARDLIMAHMKLTVSRLDTGASRNLRINGQVYGAQLKAAAANDFATIEIRPPLAIYLLGLDRNLENAQLGGYCYFAENAGKLLGATDINYSAQSGGYQVGMSGLGLVSDHDKAIASALNNLAELDQVKSGSYEVRLLRLPFSFTGSNINMLIWLKSDAGAPDLFYTHERLPPPGFQAQTLYTADEFVARLHPPQAAQGAPASP